MSRGFRFRSCVIAAIAIAASVEAGAAADTNESASRQFQAGLITGGIAGGCAITLDGAVRCWGEDTSGESGDGTIGTPAANPSPSLPVGLGQRARAVASGFRHTCALLFDSSVRCWGTDVFGELGDGTVGMPPASATPQAAVALGQPVVSVAAGGSQSCALLADGSVRCWGLDGGGELGDGTIGTPLENATPRPAVALGQPAKAVVAGDNHTCALLADGSVRCWGLDFAGQLGDGTVDPPTASPSTAVSLGQAAVALSAGNRHTCALLADGSVRCWGGDGFGQLGDGVTGPLNNPTPQPAVALGQAAVGLTSGNSHVCAALADGSVRCWGTDANGQLGDGVVGPPANPSPQATIPLGQPVRAITSGNGTVYALLADGALRGWGFDGQGQLGNGAPPADTPFPSTIGLPAMAGTAADLAVVLAAPATSSVGESVTLTLTIRNDGPDVTAATVATPLGSGLAFESATPSSGSYNAASNSWSVSLPSGTTATLQLIGRATAPGTATTTAEVATAAAADPDSLPGNAAVSEDDRASATTAISARNTTLGLKLKPKKAKLDAGDRAKFKATVTNKGPAAAAGVEICVKAPAKARGEVKAKGCKPLGEVAAGGKATTKLKATTTRAAGGAYKLTVSADATNADPARVKAKLAVSG